MKARLKKKQSNLPNPDRQWTESGKRGSCSQRPRGRAQTAEGVLAPQLSVPVGGEELNREGGREEIHQRERKRERGRRRQQM